MLPGEEITVPLTSTEVLQNTGIWFLKRLGYRQRGQTFFLAEYDQPLYVFGPELALGELEIYPSAGALNIFMTLRNVGTHPTEPGRLDVWGWKPDGETPFTATHFLPAPLPPGQAVRLRLSAPLDGQIGTWRIVEAGLWQRGNYLRLPLPERPAVRITSLSSE